VRGLQIKVRAMDIISLIKGSTADITVSI